MAQVREHPLRRKENVFRQSVLFSLTKHGVDPSEVSYRLLCNFLAMQCEKRKSKGQVSVPRHGFGLGDLIILFGPKGTKGVSEKTVFLRWAGRCDREVECYLPVTIFILTQE